jgi:hypothetical protein
MQSLVIFSLVAVSAVLGAPEADSDPSGLILNAGLAPTLLNGGLINPLWNGGLINPLWNRGVIATAPLLTSGAIISAAPAARIWKREAEAEADPSLALNGGLILNQGIINPVAGLPLINGLADPWWNRGAILNGGLIRTAGPVLTAAPAATIIAAAAPRIWKREAEADPSLIAASPLLLGAQPVVAASAAVAGSGTVLNGPSGTIVTGEQNGLTGTIIAGPSATLLSGTNGNLVAPPTAILGGAGILGGAPLLNGGISLLNGGILSSGIIAAAPRIWKREAEADPSLIGIGATPLLLGAQTILPAASSGAIISGPAGTVIAGPSGSIQTGQGGAVLGAAPILGGATILGAAPIARGPLLAW